MNWKELAQVVFMLLLCIAVVIMIVLELVSCIPFWFSGKSIFEMPWYCVRHA